MSRSVASRASPVLLVAASGFGMSMYLFRRWVNDTKDQAVYCQCQPRLKNKVVVITGATSGIGYQVALQCAMREAVVYFGARDFEKGKKVAKELQEKSNNKNIFARHLDLTDLSSCKKFADEITLERQEISYLVNNAGILNQTPKLTKDGFEIAWQTNFLGPVVVTENFLDFIGIGVRGDSAIIFVNSQSRHLAEIKEVMDVEQMKKVPNVSTFDDSVKHYGLTKKALWLYASYLAYSQSHSFSYKVLSVDPGSVWTNIFRDSWWGTFKGLYTRWKCSLLMRTPIEGAQTILHCMQGPILENGVCMKDCSHDETPSKNTVEYSPSFVANAHKFIQEFIPSQGAEGQQSKGSPSAGNKDRPRAGVV